MKLLRFLFGYSPPLVALAVAASVVSGLANVGVVALINTALGSGGYPPGALAWSFAGLVALLITGRAVSSLILTRLTQNAVFDMRLRMSRRILASPLRRLEEVGPHRLMATLNADATTLTNGLLTIPVICLQVTMLLGCLLYLAWLSRPVFVGVLAFVVVGMGSYQFGQRLAMRYLKRAREQHDELFKNFRALTEGIKELKLHRGRREAFISQVLTPTAASLRRNAVLANAVFTAAGSWGQLLFFVLIGLVLFGVQAMRLAGASVVVGYTFIILYLTVVLEVLSNTVPVLSNAGVALKKVESLGLSLGKDSDGDAPAAGPEAAVDWGSVELAGVTHTYRREREDSLFSLGPVDVTFRPGSIVFITGGNGSGKTTLAKLITGLYAPEAGEVRLNGEPVNDDRREVYRQLFSAVFSDFFLFERLLGLESPHLDARAREYLALLQLDHKVKVEDGRLSTINLSQGQRKRLALLTAYLEDRPVYVFDEWAADQDPVFKEVFYLRLLPELRARGKVVIVITHDDRYYFIADRVLKLEDGKVLGENLLADLSPVGSDLVAGAAGHTNLAT